MNKKFWKLFKPTLYIKNFSDINIKNFLDKGIKVLLIDLDNTLATSDQLKPTIEVKTFIKHLSDFNFKIIIVSNNNYARVALYAQDLKIPFYAKSLKPSLTVFKKIFLKYNFQKEEMVMIGDQLITDILGANRFGIKSVLVTPLKRTEKRMVVKINKFVEKIIFQKMTKLKLLEKGNYSSNGNISC